jgi:hypothetical protein
VKIKNIIRKMIIAAGADPAAIAVPSAVRCDNPQRLFTLAVKSDHERSPAVCMV